MHRLLHVHLIWRTQLCMLAVSLVFGLPAGATAKKRRRPAVHRVTHRRTSPLPGIVRGGPWAEPTYADSSLGDNVTGEDLTIRRIAARALGPYNGSVVIVDSATGRILSILNQSLALGTG